MIARSKLLFNEWLKNYRYHGGLAAWRRCAIGHRQLRSATTSIRDQQAPIECTVFSVIPKMTALWTILFQSMAGGESIRTLIGDCSGGLRHQEGGSFISPLLNVHHGEKLDLFFDHLCQSEIVLVADDDIFWLDSAPLRWALDRLEENPRVAVVSLVPKQTLSSVLSGKVERAMGSLLLVRRRLWREEGLSFRVKHPATNEGFGWFFDTGEFAQVELGRRGYRVDFAPAALRHHLVEFEGVSSWTLKMQKHRGDLTSAIEGIPVRQQKAMQTVVLLRGLEDLLVAAGLETAESRLLPPRILDRAERICRQLLGQAESSEIETRITGDLESIRHRLLDLARHQDLAAAFRTLVR